MPVSLLLRGKFQSPSHHAAGYTACYISADTYLGCISSNLKQVIFFKRANARRIVYFPSWLSIHVLLGAVDLCPPRTATIVAFSVWAMLMLRHLLWMVYVLTVKT